jgi:hypothetical protein
MEHTDRQTFRTATFFRHDSKHVPTGRGITMKKFGIASVIATGFAAALVGLAAPAQADLGHHDWVNQINGGSSVSVPHVDTGVHN